MEKNIKVSIITPCLNSEKTIRYTIESVLNQTYHNIEYIIIDGGSTDTTLDIINEYHPLFKGRMKYISEKDSGIYNAMNKGIKMSQGKLIGIINSDDYYETDAVEKAVSYMTDDIFQVVYGYINVIEQSGSMQIRKYKHDAEHGIPLPHPSCFVTKEVYKKYGLFCEKLKISADVELTLRLYRANIVKFILCPHVLAYFRTGGVSTNSTRGVVEYLLARLIHGYDNIYDFFKAWWNFFVF